MVRSVTVRTSVHKFAFAVLVLSLIVGPTVLNSRFLLLPPACSVIARFLRIRTLTESGRKGIFHGHTPHLLVYLSPVSGGVLGHEVSESDIVL